VADVDGPTVQAHADGPEDTELDRHAQHDTGLTPQLDAAQTGLRHRPVGIGVGVTNDLNMARRVTANVWFWQGLRWAPGGLVFFVVALTALLPDEWNLVRWLAWAGAYALWWYLYRLADQYYRRRFGVVVGLAGLHRRRTLVKWFMVYPAMAASIAVDLLVAPKVFVSGLVWAAALVLYRASTGGGRPHYFVAAATLAALTPLPTVGLLANGRPMVVLWAVVVGVLYPVLGILDHRELVRRFPLPDPS
jgi:hypothetical protein